MLVDFWWVFYMGKPYPNDSKWLECCRFDFLLNQFWVSRAVKPILIPGTPSVPAIFTWHHYLSPRLCLILYILISMIHVPTAGETTPRNQKWTPQHQKNTSPLSPLPSSSIHIQPLLLRQGLPQLAAMLSGIQHQPILGQVDGNPPIRNTWISWNI